MSTCSFDGLTGRVVTPDDPFYHEARQVYNRAVNRFPLAIVYCRNSSDVSNAVLWARKRGICLRIRSGGHNYEGFSTGNDVLDIDLSELNQLSIDEEGRSFTAEGGANNKQIYEFLSSRGYPFPGGTCPFVGVSGYVMGGGWGLSCRYLGLGCDSLLRFLMVNSEGSLITASPEENSDLFWACRGGGGGNFGIIVSMTFALPRKIDKITLVEIMYPRADQEKQTYFLLSWQDWLEHADPRITLIARIYNSQEEGRSILSKGFFYGPPEAALGSIAPLLELGGVKYRLKFVTFLEAVTIIGSFYPPYEAFISASGFVSRELSECECFKLTELIGNRPAGSIYTGLSLYALGGRVSEVPVDSTAFYYRDARYIVWLNTIFQNSKGENALWLAERFNYLSSVTTGSYVNFPYEGLPCYLEEYYGRHVCRLKKIKKEYDPCGIFTYPQAIGGSCNCSNL
ncbi:FAD-binding oxidoreductase [Lacrimispora sp.]|uniref:FAD-dependent oxidoreductase n=1 Tax=Lacrimispora sp. TaxID=2719234 RepID=UPI0029E63F91|nr:hypothetical protein [Lacrimispora sp.]